jgi:two-component system, NarL family, nitrate/nitrite response regulator NarL
MKLDKIKVVIIDDHQIVIDGLKLLLNDVVDIEVAHESTKPEDVLIKIKEIVFDVLIIDLMMPVMDGITFIKELRKFMPEQKVIVLSMNNDGLQADQLINDLNINAYLLKTIGKSELEKAIKKVAAGDCYFSEEVLIELERYEKIKALNNNIHLTVREIEIIKCISNDFTNKQIAANLFISERTVETHRKNIFRKTDAHSVVALLDFAKKMRLI